MVGDEPRTSSYLGRCWWSCCWSTLLIVDLEVVLVSDSRDLELELEFETRSRSEDLIGDTEQALTSTSWKSVYGIVAVFA